MYNSNVDLKLAKQIALNNSGLQVQLNNETLSKINYLNSMAAQNAQKNSNGLMTISVNEISLKEQKQPVVSTNRIVANETAKDKRGSNPFYHGELLMPSASQSKEEVHSVDAMASTSSIFI